MTEKKIKLPCGHEVEIRNNGVVVKTVVSTDKIGCLGIFVSEDKQSATIMAYPESLPVLRDLLIELAPLPTFKQKFLNFLKGGKS